MHLINCLKHTLFFSSFRLCFWLLKCSVDVLVLLFLQIWKKHEIIIDCNVDFLVDFCRMKFVNHVVTNFFVYNEIILEYFWICCHFLSMMKSRVLYTFAAQWILGIKKCRNQRSTVHSTLQKVFWFFFSRFMSWEITIGCHVSYIYPCFCIFSSIKIAYVIGPIDIVSL